MSIAPSFRKLTLSNSGGEQPVGLGDTPTDAAAQVPSEWSNLATVSTLLFSSGNVAESAISTSALSVGRLSPTPVVADSPSSPLTCAPRAVVQSVAMSKLQVNAAGVRVTRQLQPSPATDAPLAKVRPSGSIPVTVVTPVALPKSLPVVPLIFT